MKLICAWCGDNIDRDGYSQTLDPSTSHGMCPACSTALASQERGVSLQTHIDSIPIPILLIDGNNAVVLIYARAWEMLDKELDATGNQPFGQFFDFVHSRLPEGCGRTIHCSGCTIRRCIATTFNTGEPQTLIPASLSVESPDRLSDAVLTITTVKRDGVVLLRVERRTVSA